MVEKGFQWLQALLYGGAHRCIIIPLDQPNAKEAIALAEKMIVSGVRFFKIGLELISSGQDKRVTDYLLKHGCLFFYDGKYHDIPATVAGAVRNAVKRGAAIINVHCTGGLEMMRAAKEAAVEASKWRRFGRPLVIGVTILTSLDLGNLQRMGFVGLSKEVFDLLSDDVRAAKLQKVVVELACLAKEAGLDGVVASAQHVRAIKKACGDDFIVVTPGIRFAEGEVHDQKQVATPFNAGRDGADLLVIGRAITGAADPSLALQRAAHELGSGRRSA